jgi:GT2 family glycosyltransferase
VRWQDYVNHGNVELILVYLNRGDSSEDERQQLASLVREHNVRLVEANKTFGHFPLCLARNMGARAAKNDALVFIDADTVLDPEFLARSLRRPGKLVTCWFSYLRKNHSPVDKKGGVRELVPQGRIRRYAYGGGIVAPRSVIEEIRGFDEVYDRAWGADDNDIVDRLIQHGLEWHNLTVKENIVNLHQFHPSFINEKSPGTVANRKRYYQLQTVVRNEKGWGEP